MIEELELENRGLRERNKRLQEELNTLVARIVARLESACGRGTLPPTVISNEFTSEK